MTTTTRAGSHEEPAASNGVPPQLSFEIDNEGARNTIYVTTDPLVNKLTLKITTNATAQFTRGTPVPKKQASSGTGSLLYLDLSPLQLAAAEIDGLELTAADWQFKPYGTDGLICMTPSTELPPLEPGAGNEIDVAIGGLTLATAPAPSVSLTVTSYRVGGVTLGSLGMPSSFIALIEQAPNGGGDLSEQIGLEVMQPYVVNSVPRYDPVSNSLSILFFEEGGGLPVPAGAQTQFTLTFVYANAAPGFGALCTAQQALAAHLKQGVNAQGWGITKGSDQQNPSWQLTPPVGKPIVGTGAQATVEFILTDVITNFEPGATEMYVSWSGVPGYKDGSWAVPLIKAAHVVINTVTVTPNPSVLKDGAADVTISWDVENAGTLTLSPVGGDVTGRTAVKATLTDTTPITLAADGTQLANLGNRALFNAVATVRPVINSFLASPAPVYAKDLPRSVGLSWNVNTNGQVMLRSSVGQPDPNDYAPVGGVSKPIQAPQMFTLVPVEAPDDPSLRRSIVVSAFTTQLSQTAFAGGIRSMAVPPSASYVVVAGPSGSSITALDTILYSPLGGPISTGAGPAGMAFSPDGATLYVANSADGTLSAIAITSTATIPQYTFATIATVKLGGSPQEVAVSPDGKYVYVTIDNGSAPGSLAVLSSGSDGPTMLVGVAVGLRPRGVAVMPSGAQVYVANSGSDSVTAIGMKSGWKSSEVSTLTGFASQPVSVETSADGNVFLVVCAGSNTVYAVNATYPNTAPRKSLVVGGSPSQIARVPGGAYALVTNQADGSLSLIGIGQSPSACAVLDTVPAGPGVSGLAVSAEAGVAFAGTPSGLSVLTLAQYVQQDENLPCIGGLPTDITISPSGATAVAWHDASNTLSPGDPSTGLYVYDLKSAVVVPQLHGEKIVGFAYHPSTDASVGYAMQLGEPTVAVLDADTWQPTQELDLAPHTQGFPRGLAVAGDGATLFVLTRDAQYNYDLVIFGIDVAHTTYTVLTTLRIYTTSAGSAAHLVASPDGARAYMIDEVAGKLWVIARSKGGDWAVTGSPVAVGTLPDALAISPDGSRLFIVSRGRANYALVAVDTDTLAVQQTVLAPSSRMQLNGLAVSPDGTRVFATDGIMSGLRVFGSVSLRLIQTISWNSDVEGPWGVAVTPDASQLFTANAFSDDLGIVQQVQATPSGVRGLLERELDSERELALGEDPSYQGLLIRRSLANQPWTDCPDIWPAGIGPLTDPSVLVSQYGSDSPNGITSKATNFIYVRGQNTTSAALNARVWLYWVDASGNPDLILWPDNWGQLGLNTNYIEVSAATANQIAYTNPPFTIDGRVLTDSHYCLVAIVENPPLSVPPKDPRPITYMGDMTALAAYFASHPNMGWKNTSWLSVAQPTWQRTSTVRGPKAGGLFYVGIRCVKMPTDGHYALAMPGPDGDGTINTGTLPITTQGMINMQPVTWPENYSSTLTITYYQGQTKPTPGVSAISQVGGSDTAELLGLVDDPFRYATRSRIYPRLGIEDGVRDEWITLVGSVAIQFTA